MSQAPTREPVYLKDYRPPAFLTPEIELDFVLEPEATLVTSRQTFRRNPKGEGRELVLFGENQDLLALTLNGAPLPPERWRKESDRIVLLDPPDEFTLEVRSRIDPAANTALMGLYISNGVFCTQCEPEGFRRITYFQDRPDVMARYRVRIEADRSACPVLLSNGNPIDRGDLPGGRHWALWEDPFPKPSYLFALVAGDLACLEDEFTTRSGRKVQLRLYSEAANIGQCHHALASLKKAMKWDEDRYGLEYDLDLFQIVAVNDFNFGAMENKGLNIFNTSATLARADTSTDFDFMNVERVIAHEYFHNWTGDRVTCRDWFQLTLKEGLTVFRDQQFSADMHSPGVKRIGDVVFIRDVQFAEDAGPLAHPIRPDRYIEINNFYTATVYQKGAEVIRMLHTLLGEETYRKGIDLYFQRHDGQAVTCEDFVQAMADASGRDLGQFMRWYSQAGTPELEVRRRFDPDRQALTLEIAQRTPPTPGQEEKLPFHIPIRMGLIGRDGTPRRLQLEGENEPKGTERVLELTEPAQRFTFIGLEGGEPVPSLLRGFSAPVKLDAGYSDDELAHLMAHDTDDFVRWDAGQRLASNVLLALVGDHAAGRAPSTLDRRLIDAFAKSLDRAGEDPAFAARMLSLPSSSYLGQQMQVIDVEGIRFALDLARRELGRSLHGAWLAAYRANTDEGPFSIDTAAIARRSLKNLALAYLAYARDEEGQALVRTQYARADNMTDCLSALRLITETGMPESEAALASFYEKWEKEPLVVNKWFSLQAMIEDEAAPERVEHLMAHPAFTWSNPNRVRALLGSFAMMNLVGFHRRDGAGYRLLTDKVLELDRRNPQVAARLLSALGRWRRFDEHRQSLMRAELERVVATPGLSRDSYEIASKSLA
ncbi:aminopeptidase N [Benzoatithermus flavus]|uniref:Aminopeptidase N n=1 Tax=Benzoatithermus flavus TaxID=3108223 RepID=A0ABU8XRX5_9PROT